MFHIKCTTPVAILLLGIKDAQGVMRFPSEPAEQGGVAFDVKPGLPINGQLIEKAEAVLADPRARKIEIVQEFSSEVDHADGRRATLYLATLPELDGQAQDSWPTMPVILRQLSKDRGRLPYLRAWQVLTGGLTLNTKAIESGDLKGLLDQ